MLKPEDNFCSNCGQENHDLKVGMGQLLYDVFEGFTNFDTKFYNTAKSIFSQPGKITKDFLREEGHAMCLQFVYTSSYLLCFLSLLMSWLKWV
jgi:hypothetical protein